MNRHESQATGASTMVRKLVVLLAIVVIAELIVMIGSIVVGDGLSGADLAASIVRILLVALSGAFLLGRDNDEAPVQDSKTAEAPQQSDGIVTVWPNIDELTHTSNQRGLTIHMLEMMALAERYHHKLSVCLIDVSGLDALSQEDREETLIGIATVLAELVRIPDKVGRYDEESFMVIMPEADYAGASLVAGRLQSNLDKTVSNRTRITMGVAEFERGDDLQRLLDRAQQALDKA